MTKKIEGRPYPSDGYPQLSNADLPSHRAHHMIAGMAAITEYSQVEAHVSLLITHLASADPAPIAAIYGELRQGQLQAKALKAVAKVSLPADDYQLLLKLMAVLKCASDARDIFAHRIWMYDLQLPKDIVLVNPALLWLTEHQTQIGGGPGPQEVRHVLGIQDMMRRESQLWSVAELERARIASVHSVVGLQAFSLMHRASIGSGARAEERQKVLNVLELSSR